MLLPLLLTLGQGSLTLDNPQSIYDLGAVPVASQPLLGPTASFWSRISRVVQLDLPLAYNPTGIAERWTLGLPDVAIYNGDAVVLFHGQQNHFQVPLPLIQVLNAAGYIVIVPQGGQHTHYGSQISSDITEGVLRWVTERWPIDDLFAYGFSHGGGSSASFAARHPGWFTGLLQHTGTVDLPASSVLDPGQNNTGGALAVIYGPLGPTTVFDYTRMSTKNSPMGANLSWVPWVHYTGSSRDPSWGPPQNSTPALWPESVMWGSQRMRPRWGGYSVVNHRWDNVPYQDVVTWLQGAQGLLPARTGDLAIDRSGDWGLLAVTQATPRSFSSLRFDFNPTRADVSALSNVSEVAFDATELGWVTAPGTALRVHLVGSPVVLRIAGLPAGTTVAPSPLGPPPVWNGGVLVVTQTSANAGWMSWNLQVP